MDYCKDDRELFAICRRELFYVSRRRRSGQAGAFSPISPSRN